MGGISAVETKLLEKFWIGLLVISEMRGDKSASQSSLSRLGRSLLIDISPNPKSKPPNLEIAESGTEEASKFFSGLARALSRAEALGV